MILNSGIEFQDNGIFLEIKLEEGKINYYNQFQFDGNLKFLARPALSRKLNVILLWLSAWDGITHWFPMAPCQR